MCGWDLLIILGNKEFYKLGTNESYSSFQSYHLMILDPSGYNCGVILSLLLQCRKHSVSKFDNIEFFIIHFANLKMLKTC